MVGKELRKGEQMKRQFASIAAVLVGATLMMVGCTQAAPAATQTKAAPAPTKAAEPTKASVEPTKAATTQPAAAAAKKADYPTRGKPITLFVPWGAGGSSDIAARLLTPYLEKELGTPVQVVNKPGAGTQVGMTELSLAKPDGYTLGYSTMVPIVTAYLDPERKATYTRKDLQPVAMHGIEPGTVAVKIDSPYRTLKDLVEAAKANPEKVKGSTAGILSLGHISILKIEQAAGAKIAPVAFESGAALMTAMLGGHVDAAFSNLGDCVPLSKDGKIRVLAVFEERTPFLPEVKTAVEQGYNFTCYTTFGLMAPRGTPKEIVEILDGAVKRVTDNEDHRRKVTEMGRQLRYMNSAQFDASWAKLEAELEPLVRSTRQ